jgi:uncharacterized protein YbjQ (UPF0145 family)
MQVYESPEVPGRPARRLGRINAREVAVRERVAERVAREQLEKKAGDKGADAIVSFSVTRRLILSGNECIVSGIAVKFTD